MRSGKEKSSDNVLGAVSRYIQIWRGRECVSGLNRRISNEAKLE